MNQDDKHKWKKVNVGNEDVSGGICNIKAKHICTRGDCNYIRWSKIMFVNGKPYSYFTYERGMRIFSENRLDCFGDIPINQQTID